MINYISQEIFLGRSRRWLRHLTQFCLAKLAEAVKRTIFADVGYLQKKNALKRMEEKGIKFEAAPRKNMNRLMSRFECYHIKHRSIFESNWGTLKNNCQLEYHKARSIVGMFRTYLIFLLFPAPFPAFYSYLSI
ncbi:MAG: transposase [Treponema sp.]|nr:transposase [Treponema sp.]